MAIQVEVVSDSKRAQEDLARLNASVGKIQDATSKASKSFSTFATATTAIFTAFAAGSILTKTSDTLTNLNTRLKIVTKSQDELNVSFRAVTKIALDSRSNLSAVGDLYSKVARSGKQLGASQRDIVTFTDNVTKSIALSGSSAQSSTAAIIQLGQALASNRLSGDELRSILENAPALAEALAKGLKISVGELRKLGEQGQLTSVKVFKSLLSQTDEINSEFKKVGITFAGAFTNLGTSFTLIFDAVSKAISGSRGSFAGFINDIALRIANIATNFSFILYKVRIGFIDFAIYVVDLFDRIKDSLDEVAQKLVKSASALYTAWTPALKGLAASFVVWSSTAKDAIKSVYGTFTEYLSGTAIGQALMSGFASTITFFKTIKDTIVDVFTDIFPTIDVGKFFPNLDVVLGYIRKWSLAVEGWFFYLYDKVIGNSWIPDLVLGVIYWMKKLLGTPLKLVAEFVSKSNAGFKSVSFGSIFTVGLVAAKKYYKSLLLIAGVLGGIALAYKAFGQGGLPSNIKVQTALSGNKVQDTLAKIQSKLSKLSDSAIKWFGSSTFGRTVKQLFGVKDTVPGKVFGDFIDTGAFVGRGTQRNSPDRSFLHDFVNAFPREIQIPLLATLTGVFSLAIVAATQSGGFRSALLGILTTIFAIVVARTVDQKTTFNFTTGLANSFVQALKSGLDALFGGYATKDPLGVLATIAKLALLFKSGRAFIGNALLGAATAPTRAVNIAGDAFTKRGIDAQVKSLDKAINNLPKDLANNARTTNEILRRQLNKLADSNDRLGNRIGLARAQAAINSGGSSFQFGLASAAALFNASRANAVAEKANRSVGNESAIRDDLVAQQKALTAQSETLGNRVAAAKDATVTGIKNTTAGAAGIIGGIAGFQIGAEIAKGMATSPAWVKTGVTLAASFVGQGVGSAIGYVIATAILGVGKLITVNIALAGIGFGLNVIKTLLLRNPFVVGATLLAAALLAGYTLFKSLPEDWQKALKADISNLGNSLFTPNDPKAFGTVKDTVTRADPTGISKIVFTIIELHAQMKERFYAIFETLYKVHRAILNFIIDFGKQIKRNFDNLTKDGLGGLFSKVTTAIVDGFKGIFKSILDTIIPGARASELAPNAPKASALPKIAADTLTDPSGKPLSFTSKFSDAFSESLSKVKPVFDKISSALTGGTDGIATPTVTPTAKAEAPTLKALVENAKTLNQSNELLAKAFKTTGIAGGIKASDFNNIPASIAIQIAEVLGNIQEANAVIARRGSGSLQGRLAQEKLNLSKGELGDLLAQQKSVGNVDSKFIELPGKIDEKDVLRVKDQFDIVATTFPELGLSIGEFVKFADNLREDLVQYANGIRVATSKIEETEIGNVKLPKTKRIDLTQRRADLETTRSFELDAAKSRLSGARSPGRQLVNDFGALNIQITEAIAAKIAAFDSEFFTSALETLKSAQANISLPASAGNESIRTASADLIKKTTEEVQKRLTGLELPEDSFARLSRELSGLGIEGLDRVAFNLLSKTQENTLRELGQRLKKESDNLKDNKDLSEGARYLGQKTVNELNTQIADVLSKLKPEYESQAKLAGKAFGSNITEAVASSLKDALKGKKDDVDASYFVNIRNRIVDAFTSNVLDSAVNGIISAISKENGFLDSVLESLGINIFETFANLFGGNGDRPEAEVAFTKALNKFTETFGPTLGIGNVGGVPTSQTSSGGLFQSIKDFFGIGSDKEGVQLGALPEDNAGLVELDPESVSGANVAVDAGIESGFNRVFPKLSGIFSETILGLSKVFSGFTQGFFGLFNSFASLFGGGGGSKSGSLLNLGLGIFSAFSGGFGGGGGGILPGGANTPIPKLIRVASGGYVRGAGTGVSDSIPAMLSNGEFVVNAQSTGRYKGLLESINRGSPLRFADGGFVNAGNTALPMPGSFSSSSSVSRSQQTRNQSVFNINVTGNISQQTREEIQRMIPEIATGVNSHNYEQGNK